MAICVWNFMNGCHYHYYSYCTREHRDNVTISLTCNVYKEEKRQTAETRKDLLGRKCKSVGTVCQVNPVEF